MEIIKDFNQVLKKIQDGGEKKKVAIVWASDHTTRAAVAKALQHGLIQAVFVGCRPEVEGDPDIMAHAAEVTIVDAPDGDAAALEAVKMVRNHDVDFIMKGMLNTDNLLRAVLNKEVGILKKGDVLTHIATAQIPGYHKVLLFSDAAVIPYPTDEQRHAQVKYIVNMSRALGSKCPKVALIHCSEKVDARHFPFTADYETIKEMAQNGEFGECIVDGPFDVKTACSLAAMKKKGLDSPLQGDADAVIFPDIEAGNTFYKTLTLFAGAEMAGLVVGAMCPIVVPSRGDNEMSKFNSLLMAIINS